MWSEPAGQANGCVNYAGALAVDPWIQALTRDVPHHMGVGRPPMGLDQQSVSDRRRCGPEGQAGCDGAI